MATHCTHCLMTAETTGTGVVETHGYPYAPENYGVCKGSGQPPVTGPGFPPAAWGWNPGATWLELGVLPSPVPHIEREGWTVTITGVRFSHGIPCPKCRRVVHLASDRGSIRIGFDSRGRSFEKLQAGPRPAYSGLCPNECGATITLGTRQWEEHSPRPVADGWTVQCREWEQLRQRLGVASVDMTPADMARLRSGGRR